MTPFKQTFIPKVSSIFLTISLFASFPVTAGITTTDGENITGQEIVEDAINAANEEGNNGGFGGSFGDASELDVIHNSTSLCEDVANELGIDPNTQPDLMPFVSELILFKIQETTFSQIGSYQVLWISADIGEPVFESVTCVPSPFEPGTWLSVAHISTPVTIHPWGSKPKSGTIDIYGHLMVDRTSIGNTPPVSHNCLYVDNTEVIVKGLDFWLKSAIANQIESKYCDY